MTLWLTACSGGAAGGAATPTAAAPPTNPPTSLIPVKIVWSGTTGANAGLWTAADLGYLRDAGLDATVSQAATSAAALDALNSNDAQLANVEPAAVVQAVARGRDVRLFYAAANKLIFSVLAGHQITQAEEMQNRSLGITSVGTPSHDAALQALKLWNLEPDQDVAFIQLSDEPNIFTALRFGRVDAGVLSPPVSLQAKAAGFTEILNLATSGPDYPTMATAATGPYLAGNPGVAQRYVRAYLRGVQKFKTDQQTGTAVLAKYMQLGDDPDAVLQVWQEYARALTDVPYLPDAGMQRVIDDVAASEPNARGTQPSTYVDNGFVKEMDDQSLLKKS